MKNPCAKNPCAMKNPCAKNPCAMKKMKNPCASNPCAAKMGDPKLAKMVTRPEGSKPYRGSKSKLEKMGANLWSDSSLSTNGLSCSTCHRILVPVSPNPIRIRWPWPISRRV